MVNRFSEAVWGWAGRWEGTIFWVMVLGALTGIALLVRADMAERKFITALVTKAVEDRGHKVDCLKSITPQNNDRTFCEVLVVTTEGHLRLVGVVLISSSQEVVGIIDSP